MDHTEENSTSDPSNKLIPEWSRDADEQVIFAGIAAAIVFFGILGWSFFTNGDESDISAADVTVVADDEESEDEEDEATADTDEVVDGEIGDVQAAVDGFPGDITGVATGSTAVLEGFVANEGESTEAETAALEVTGIDTVDNQLEILEPPVLAALEAEGVDSPGVDGTGTVVTVTGTVESEEQAETVLAAAGEVPGVTEVIDELDVPLAQEPQDEEEEPEDEAVEEEVEEEVQEQVADITDQLNELPQVQFDNASSTINESSFADLDQAVELLGQIDENYSGTIQVQGYTDTSGDAVRNQQLSEERAQAVMDYLIDNGVSEDLLTSEGFGETTEFGPELEDNRLVRFEPLG